MEMCLKKIISRLFSHMRIRVSDENVDNIIQFIKFGIVGVSNTLIGYFINVLVLYLLHPYNVRYDYFVGNVVSFVLSVLWSFYWNNRFVFKLNEDQSRSILKSLLKSYIAYGFTGIVLNNALSWIWVEVIYISKYIAPLINLLISVPLNYILNKLWAFRTKR